MACRTLCVSLLLLPALLYTHADDSGESGELNINALLRSEFQRLKTDVTQKMRELQEELDTFEMIFGMGEDDKYKRISPSLPNRYKLSTVGRSWADAKAACEAEGAALVSIETRTEDRALEELVKQTHKAPVWTSGTDEGHEGRWVWSSTGSRVSYTNWGRGEPNNDRREEHCMQKRGGSTFWRYRWNDARCGQICPYICEKKA